jgi:GNAT superfamily N-acetyltransferase
MIRFGKVCEVLEIQALYKANSETFGFINRAMITEAIESKRLLVDFLNGVIRGVCTFNKRKDLVTVIYEIVVKDKYRGQGIGKALISCLSLPIRVKCPEGEPSNTFYEHIGFIHKETVDGRKRRLNVWIKE